MYYTINEIYENVDEIFKNDEFIIYDELNENEKKENDNLLINKLNILENSINYKLLNDKYNYNEFFDINLNIYPIYEKYNDKIILNNDKTISYYTYKEYCFKSIDSLIEYIVNELKTLHNYKHIQDIDIDEINIIFDDLKRYYNDLEFYKNDELYQYIENIDKIIENDELYLNVIIENSYDEFIDSIYNDLFNNFINDEIKDYIQYDNFKLIYDDRIINYYNYWLYDEINENDLSYLLISDIKDNYNNYFNRYYDLNKHLSFKYELYDEKNDNSYIYDEFQYDEIQDKINELTSFKLFDNDEIILKSENLYDVFDDIIEYDLNMTNISINKKSLEKILYEIIFNSYDIENENKLYELYNSIKNEYDNNYYFNKEISNNLKEFIYELLYEEMTLKEFIDEMTIFNKNDKYFIIKNDEYKIYSTNNLFNELDQHDIIQFILNNDVEILKTIQDNYYDELNNYSSL